MNKNRRNFIKKTCISATCFCGFGSLANASISGEDQTSFEQKWISSVLENIGSFGEEEQIRNLVKESSSVHYDDLKMDVFLNPYLGKVKEFNSFIEKEWGWRISYDENKGEIIVDENKDYCVCPLMKNSTSKLPALCYCSEGFAEKMYSKVAGKPVSARVISSVQRGDSSCKYSIKIPD